MPGSRRWLPAALTALVLLFAAIVPGSGGSWPRVLGVSGDRWLHAAGYGLLAATLCRALAPTARRRSLVALVAVLVTVAYGGGTELLQTAVPGRTAGTLDWGADALGAVVAAVAWVLADGRTVAWVLSDGLIRISASVYRCDRTLSCGRSRNVLH